MPFNTRDSSRGKAGARALKSSSAKSPSPPPSPSSQPFCLGHMAQARLHLVLVSTTRRLGQGRPARAPPALA
jgi:hypothetical protein